MAGGKKKKASDAADAELVRIQKQVASVWNAKDAGDLLQSVADITTGAASRHQMQAGLYLLLRRLPDVQGAKPGIKPKLPAKQEQQLSSLLEKLTDEACEQLRAAASSAAAALAAGAAAADSQKPPLVLAWAVALGLARRADLAAAEATSTGLHARLVTSLEPFFSSSGTAEEWLDQWHPVLEYPAAAAQDPTASNQQQLRCELGVQLARTFAASILRSGGTTQDPLYTLAMEVFKTLQVRRRDTHDMGCSVCMQCVLQGGCCVCLRQPALALPNHFAQPCAPHTTLYTTLVFPTHSSPLFLPLPPYYPSHTHRSGLQTPARPTRAPPPRPHCSSR
jgi:hypothetical protein